MFGACGTIHRSIEVIEHRRMSETPKKRKLLSNRVRSSRKMKRKPVAKRKEQSSCRQKFVMEPFKGQNP
jgi:hypothetical protein